MKIVPTKVDHEINSPPDRPLVSFLSYSFAIVAIFGVIYGALGLVVDLTVDRMSFQTEVDLFKPLLGSFDLNEQDSTNSKKVLSYLESLYHKLDSNSQLTGGVAPTIHIVKDQVPNAMAIPGNHIAFTTGLLKLMRSENGLAFVMAHELGHLKHRDNLRHLGRGLPLLILTTFLFGDSETVNFLSSGIHTMHLAYSRTQEAAADDVGLALLQKYAGSTVGAEEFFDLLNQKASSVEKNLDIYLEFFSTHPSSAYRIERLRATHLNSATKVVGLPKQIIKAIAAL